MPAAEAAPAQDLVLRQVELAAAVLEQIMLLRQVLARPLLAQVIEAAAAEAGIFARPTVRQQLPAAPAS